MKNMLYGTADQEPHTESCAQLAQEMYNNNMLLLLIQNLHRIDFEVCTVLYFVYGVLPHVLHVRRLSYEDVCASANLTVPLNELVLWDYCGVVRNVT